MLANINSIRVSKKSLLRILIFIAILMGLATIRPLSHPDEGRYAEIGRWMLQSGDWLIPRLNGLPFFHKPPLLYWLEALSFSALGVYPWVARLTPVFHAGLMLFGVHVLVARFSTETLANRAVAMVGTSLAFLAGGQYVNHDLMVATWISIAIGSFAIAFMNGEKPDIKFSRLGFIACGIGVLSKGLIGFVLPGLVLLIWLIWTHQFKKIKDLPWLSGLSLFTLIAIPWFVLAEKKFPSMLNYMFGMHHFERFTGAGFNNVMPWWFYLAGLLVLFFPWIFFSFISFWKLLGQEFTGLFEKAYASKETAVFSSKMISLCWVWVIVIIGFFTIPAAKVIGYALPVIPPLAVLAVVGWKQVMSHRSHERLYFIVICAINVIVALSLTLEVGKSTQKNSAVDVGQMYACLSQPSDALYILDGYPYDLPFELKLKKPLLVAQDWESLRFLKSDNWHNELMDAADFDPAGTKVLTTIDQLKIAQTQNGNWLIATSNSSHKDILSRWIKVTEGSSWMLYHSLASDNAEADDALNFKALSKCSR
jgi:4-amino-4-deoxy-L-arabinose transferase-like glycosyltransferase